MNNTLLNAGKLQHSLPILSRLIASTLLLEILSSILTPVNAQPTNQANSTREAQAREYIGIINRAQQTFYLENGKFASTIEQLGVPIKETKDYFYGIFLSDLTQSAIAVAKPYDLELKGYIGGTFSLKAAGKDSVIVGTCETIKPGLLPGTPQILKSGSDLDTIECPAGYQLLQP